MAVKSVCFLILLVCSFITVRGAKAQTCGSAPDQPAALSPNGSSNESTTPNLSASDFSDADGDSLNLSRWRIRQADGAYGGSGSYDTTVSGQTSFTVPASTLSYDTTYYWHVQYQDDSVDANWSVWSGEASFSTSLPGVGAPAITSAVVTGCQVKVVWSDNSTEEEGYKVERSPDGVGTWSLLYSTPADDTSYTDTGLDAGTTYYYQVKSFAAGYADQPSNVYNTTVPDSLLYEDNDGDGYGDPARQTASGCGQTGYADNNTDCDDTDAYAHPGAYWYVDIDGDRYWDDNTAAQNQCADPGGAWHASDGTYWLGVTGDCDDSNALINNDTVWYYDFDNDGHSDQNTGNDKNQCVEPSPTDKYKLASELSGISNDCDDNNNTINPGITPETNCNGIDDNCDGQTDENLLTTYYKDNDGDTYGSQSDSMQLCSSGEGAYPQYDMLDNSDCNDNDPNIKPTATEVCDGVDNNCDGNTDENVTVAYYHDLDQDGYGGEYTAPGPDVTYACTDPTNGGDWWSAYNTDCSDNDSAISPDTVWWYDPDLDGYGHGTSQTQCQAPGADWFLAASLNNTNADCGWNDPTIYLGAPEICDGYDNNCNGTSDEGFSLAGRNVENLGSSWQSGTRISLEWDDISTCEYGYKIERKKSGDPGWGFIYSATANSHQDTGLEYNTLYSYRIQAYIGSTESNWSGWSDPALTISTTGNTPPARPVNSSPSGGANPVARTPVLSAQAISDAEDGNSGPQASHWQLTTLAGDYTTSNLVYDSNPVSNTVDNTTHTVSTLLAVNQKHLWRARYQDSYGAWSDNWSVETSFTTGDDLPSGALVYWKFDTGSGTTVYDSYDGDGAYENGTFVGSPGWVAGRNGTALDFDGNNDYVDFGNPSVLRITGNMTIEMWVKPDNLAGGRQIYGKAKAGEGAIDVSPEGALTFMYGKNGDNSNIYQPFGSEGIFTGNDTVTAGVWSHIVLVRDLTDMKLRWYINGVKTNEENAWYSASEVIASNLNAGLGEGDLADTPITHKYAGIIEDMVIYNQALSDEQIRNRYSDSAPARPNTLYPLAPNHTNISLTPALSASTFADAEGDNHAGSRWEIRGADGAYGYGAPDYYGTTTGVQINFTLPVSLDTNTAYYWRVQYQDDTGAWSAFSPETSFTTQP